MYFRQANTANFSNYSRKDIKYIVIHYTAGSKDTARNNVDAFATHATWTSAHYFVDENEVAQSVSDFYPAYHCGGKKYNNGSKPEFYCKCRNFNSIGIEMCSRKYANGKFYIPDATQRRTAQFVVELMRQYNIPINHVIRHYDVTGKYCPEPFVRNQIEWERFKILVNAILNNQEEDYRKDEEPEMKYYEKASEIQDREIRATIEGLVKSGVIRGTETGLHLSEDMVRILTYLKRAKVL